MNLENIFNQHGNLNETNGSDQIIMLVTMKIV